MKVFVATVLLAICLSSQARNVPVSSAITFRDYYKQNNERIISGEQAVLGQFPYQAAISMLLDDGRPSFCGGSLINDQWILTAAHCGTGVVHWDVKLGGILYSEFEPTQVFVRSTTGVVHPDYNSKLNNDLALVKLPQPVTFNDYIQPIRLPSRSELNDLLENEPVVISGWGLTSDDGTNPSTNLNYVNLNTISNSKCGKSYGPGSVISSTLCAVGHPEHSPCKGDSGGPLVHIADDGQLTQIGVASFVHPDGCASGQPSAFARTVKFLDWIHEVTGLPIRD